jgi:hypothetical protein
VPNQLHNSHAIDHQGLFLPRNNVQNSANRMSADDTMNTTAKTPQHDWSRFDAMTEAERHAAALADPDAQPLTEDELRRIKPTPQARVIRRAVSYSARNAARLGARPQRA